MLCHDDTYDVDLLGYWYEQEYYGETAIHAGATYYAYYDYDGDDTNDSDGFYSESFDCSAFESTSSLQCEFNFWGEDVDGE